MFVKLRQLAREPLVHFLLIGAGIYALYGVLGDDPDAGDERRVVVTAADIDALAAQWQRMWNRPPTEDELAGIVRQHVRVKILHREALAMGLDSGDLVIERRLAQKVEMLASSLATPPEPPEEDLRAWYSANPDAFKAPDRYTLSQVYFDPEKRPGTLEDDVLALINRLNALDGPPPGIDELGDRLMLESHYSEVTELDLRKTFGTRFADEILLLESGQWHGPVVSGYGVHAVMIWRVDRTEAPEFETVRGQISDNLVSEQIDEGSERFIENLVSRYEVVIEAPQTATAPLADGARQ